jgi:nucleotide-binding universal stress UspA family protein
MMMKILVAIDGSEHGWKAVDFAIDLAKSSDAELLLIHVVPYEPLPRGLLEFARAEKVPIEEENARYHYSRTLGDAVTSAAETRAREQGLSKVVAWTAEGRPADCIIGAAQEHGAGMIVMGSRGHSDASALFLGSVSHKVTNHAHCTCVTVK